MLFTVLDLPPFLGRATIFREGRDFRDRIVGDRVYRCSKSETFAEFLLTHLKWVLGRDWVKSEVAKPPTERHPIMTWFYDQSNHSKTVVRENHDKRPVPALAPGSVRDLVALAYDLYQLYHTVNIPVESIDRLRRRRDYQSAIYEISVAAVFARLGFRIAFLANAGEARHPEFIAHRPDEKISIAVEVKSRRRPGTHSESGVQDARAALEGSLSKLVRQAMLQLPEGLPSAIFVDMNVPKTPGQSFLDKPWRAEIERVVGRDLPRDETTLDPVTCLYFTNWWSQFLPHGLGIGAEFVAVESARPTVALPDSVRGELRTAISQHGVLPDSTY